MNKNAIALPSLKKDTKLPVILNREELKELFAAPTLLKQRVVLALIYSAGLRAQEVINLKISDIDTQAKQASKKTETSIERFERLTGFKPSRCPVCKTGHLIIVRELPRIRSPGPLFSMTAIAY